MKNLYITLLLCIPFGVFSQTKTIAFSELTPGSGMYFGASMTPTTITVTVQGPSDRFIAFGFGTGMASGNDAIIWSTLGTGAAPLQLRDHKMVGQGVEPTVDAQQDWTEISNTVSAGNRTIVASRALNTGDANDVVFDFNATSQNLFWAHCGSASNQLQYHGSGNRASGIVRTWSTPDVTPPTLASTSPLDNAVGVAVGTNLTFHFSENISWGTGSIKLYDASNTLIHSASSGSSTVTISGSTLVVNPPGNLVMNTSYYVNVDADALQDAAGNFFAGIADNTTWNFNTNDVVAPLLATNPFVPADNSTGVALTTPLSITFNENIQAGTGSIELYNSTGTLVESYDVTSSPLITISGNNVSINPTDLVVNTSYYVHIPGGAIKDLAGNNYAGFTNNTTWNWDTDELVAPVISAFSPADNATNVPVTGNFIITFNEDIQFGTTGTLDLFESNGTLVQSFPVSSTDITVSGNTASFSSASALTESTSYYVHIGAGYFEDVVGNAFAGIADNTTWNFTVGDFTAPTYVTLNPADNSQSVPVNSDPVVTFSENIAAGTGSFFIVPEDGGSVIGFSNALGNITVSGNTITLNYNSSILQFQTNYHILIDNDAVLDLAGNAFAGISDTTEWSFRTEIGEGLNELKFDDYSWNGKDLIIKMSFVSGEVRDMNGRTVKKITDTKTTLTGLPTGIYNVYLQDDKTYYALRIYVD